MPYSLETRCIHGGGSRIEDPYCAISTPIYQTASFAHIKLGSPIPPARSWKGRLLPSKARRTL